MNGSPWHDSQGLVVFGIVCVLLSGCAATPERLPETPVARIIPRVQPESPAGDPGLGALVDLGGARIQIPKGWVPTGNATLQWENAGGGDDQRPSAANMNVIVGDAKRLDVSWESFWDELSQQYHERTEGIQEILGEGRDDLAGYPTYYFRIERREGGVRFTLLQYIIGTDRFVYYVTFAARLDEFPRYEPLFRRCAVTFAEK